MKANNYSIKWKDIWKFPLSKLDDLDYVYSSSGVLAVSNFKDEWSLEDAIINKIVDIINGDIESDFLPEWQAKGCDILYQGEYAFSVRGWGYLISQAGLNLSIDAAKKIQDEFISYKEFPMNLAKYQALLSVVESGSLTAAAAQLGLTQSAVSHSINSLEEELGFAVIKRSRAGVRLTNEGERLLPAVRGLLNSAEQLNQVTASIRGLDSGLVRIGAFTSVAVHWLPGVLKEFQRDYPRVDFRLLNGDYHDVEQWLRDGSIDIGFVNLPSPLDCECVPLMEDRLMAILPKDSRFASYPKFPLVECETEPFISLLQSSDHDARRALEAAGVTPNVRFYTKDDYAIIAMVEQGLGISIMPELLLKGRHDDLLVLPLIPEAKRTIGIAIAAGEKAGPATRRFADYVVRYVKEQA